MSSLGGATGEAEAEAMKATAERTMIADLMMNYKSDIRQYGCFTDLEGASVGNVVEDKGRRSKLIYLNNTLAKSQFFAEPEFP